MLVPINTSLVIRAHVESTRGRRLRIRGDLSASTADNEVLAEARGAFLHVPLEHFLQTPEGRASAEAWSRRLTGD